MSRIVYTLNFAGLTTASYAYNLIHFNFDSIFDSHALKGYIANLLGAAPKVPVFGQICMLEHKVWK